jgi:hypothetical protein
MSDLPFVQQSYNKAIDQSLIIPIASFLAFRTTPHDREQFFGWWKACGVWRPTSAGSIFGLHLQTCAVYSCNLKEGCDT